jgi:hypothetical protein
MDEALIAADRWGAAVKATRSAAGDAATCPARDEVKAGRRADFPAGDAFAWRITNPPPVALGRRLHPDPAFGGFPWLGAAAVSLR